MNFTRPRPVFFALAAAAWIAVVWFSGEGAWRSLWAATRLGELAFVDADLDDPARVHEIRRTLQKHFLDYAIYIPLEDIAAASSVDGGSGSLSLLMQKACGQGRLYVWIPLRFRLPIVGEKVVEWCFKPQTKVR